MFIKGTVMCTDNHRCEKVDVEIDPGSEKGSIYTLDFELAFKAKTIRDENSDLTYYIEVTKCTPGRGCRFKIKDIVGE